MTRGVILCFLLVLALFLLPNPVSGAKLSQCTASSQPQGVLVVGSAVWIALSTTSKIGESSTGTCSVTNYAAQNDPRFLAVAGNGKLAFTQKGLGGPGTSCISAFDQTTHVVGPSFCQDGEFDDVTSQPSPPSNSVYASLYLRGLIYKFDTGTGVTSAYSMPNPAGCATRTGNPEGIRQDESGYVWVADEAKSCPRLWRFNSGFHTWMEITLPTSARPWFLSVDTTAGKLWITSNDSPQGVGSFYNMVLTSFSFAQIGLPTGQTMPYYLEVDHDDSRVYTTFSSGYVNEYFFGSNPTWLCGSGDNYGSSSQPWGIYYVAPNYYWAALLGNDQLAKGDC